VAQTVSDAKNVASTGLRNHWKALALLVATLAVTLIISLYFKASAEATAGLEFNFACDAIQLNIADRLAANAQVLRSGAALFNVSDTVSREAWRTFIAGLQIELQLPGIQGVGFAQLVPRGQLVRHIQEIRGQGFPDYQLRPPGEREVYSSIIYLEPFSDRNLRAFGYDMLTERVRREAMERSRDENVPVLSGKVVLVQETGQDVQAGTLMYVPVYRHGMPVETVGQRRAAILGWVYSPYRMADLIRGTLQGWDERDLLINLQVYDGDVVSTDSLLYDSRGAAGKTPASHPQVSRLTPVDFTGRRWTLSFTQAGGLASTADYGIVWFVVACGIIISLLLFGLMLSLLNTSGNARRMAGQLTADLRESEEKYSVVFNNEIYATCIFDLETRRVLDFNGAFVRLYGYSREELLAGMSIYDLSTEVDATDDSLERATSAGSILIPVRHQRKKDGTVFPVEIVGGPYLWRGRKVMFSLAHEITDRVKAEEALKQTWDRLSMATRVAGVGIWDYDVIENKLVWDDKMFALYGITPDQFGGAYDAWRAGLHPEDRQRGDDEIQLALRGEKDFDTEFRVAWPDGSTHHIRAYANVQRDGEGRAVRMTGTNWDITPQKQAERELILSREEAYRANRAKSEFLSSMSHELRTPMNAILGFGQLLDLDKSLGPSQLDYVQEITKAGRHLLELINEVLDLSRIETGKIDLSMEPVACDALIDECISLVDPLATKRGISLNHESTPELAVFADRIRLKQVVVNLLSNAIKYNSPEGRVDVACSVEDGKVSITVTDTGPGIPKDRMVELFVPFSRLGAEAGEIEGTGIGLTISKRLTEMMGGRIGARSTVGIGSSFWIELPLVVLEEGTCIPLKGGSSESSVLHSEAEFTILYIEDNPANLRLVGQILGLRPNIHLLTAPEPSIGLDLAEAYQPDLILLDLNLPEMDGYGVLRVLRSHEWGRHIPVVAVTAHAMHYDVQRGKEAGFIEYLTKPLDIPRFLAVVDGQVDGKAQRKIRESTHE